MEFFRNKKAFTLVELIVVITILAVLATIWYISMVWYSQSARDSKRLSDIKSIQTSLNLHVTREDLYPEPTNPTTITYAWEVMWTQWVFGDDTIKKVKTISEAPEDPKFGSLYQYSVSNNRLKYQLGWINEQTSQAYLWTKTNAQSYNSIVKWNYNGLVLRTQSYVLAVPSIMIGNSSVDLDNNTTVDLNGNNQIDLVDAKWSNIPYSYKWVENSQPVYFDFSSPDVVLQDSTTKINTTQDPSAFSDLLYEAYKNYNWNQNIALYTDLYNKWNDTWATTQDENELISYTATIINKELGGKVVLTFCTLDGNTYSSGEDVTVYDSNTAPYWTTPNNIVVTCNEWTWSWDVSVYRYTSFQAADALACNILWTQISHGDSITAYLNWNIAWDSSDTCSSTSTTQVCNNGTINIDTNTFTSLTCTKWTASNCSANSNYTYNWKTYSIWSLNHNVTDTISTTVNENNGNYTYELTVTCNDWSYTGISESTPVLTTCAPGSTEVSWSCYLNCSANSNYTHNWKIYSIWALNHNVSDTVSTTVNENNGIYNYNLTLTCNDWSYTSLSESTPTLSTCNTWYTQSWGSCYENCQSQNVYLDSGSRQISSPTANSHNYSLSAINHWESLLWLTSSDFPIDNGTATLRTNFYCTDGSLTNDREWNKAITSCVTDYYAYLSECIAVGTWYYSDNGSTTRTACTNKPANSTYTWSWNWGNNCSWSCDSWYVESNWSCVVNNSLTGLAMTHTSNNKSFYLTWNGTGYTSYTVQVSRHTYWPWMTLGTINQTSFSNYQVNLWADGWAHPFNDNWQWYIEENMDTNWNFYKIRLLANNWDEFLLTETLTCSPMWLSQTATPNIDEDCDSNWDNYGNAYRLDQCLWVNAYNHWSNPNCNSSYDSDNAPNQMPWLSENVWWIMLDTEQDAAAYCRTQPVMWLLFNQTFPSSIPCTLSSYGFYYTWWSYYGGESVNGYN